MHIVMIEDFFHPKAGYQINTLAPALVKRGYKVTIVTSQLEKIPEYLKNFFGVENIEKYDNEFFSKTGVRIIRIPILTYYSGRSIYKHSLVKFVKSLSPDLLFVHGMDTFAGILFILKSGNLPFPLIVDCHMTNIAAKNKFSKYFKKIYQKFITPKIVENSIHIIDVTDCNYPEVAYGVLKRLVTNIPLMNVDTSVFKPDKDLRRAFRNKNGIPQEAFVVTYAGKIDESKGGMILAEALSQPLHSKSKDVYILIVSSNNEPYAQKVREIISNSGNKFVFLPTLPFELLPELYNATDLFVIPKQSSMSFFHAQACGVPVILEDNPINLQRASNAGVLFFRSGDSEKLRERITEFINLEDSEVQQLKELSRKFILENYDFEKSIDEYERVFKKSLDSFQLGTKNREKFSWKE